MLTNEETHAIYSQLAQRLYQDEQEAIMAAALAFANQNRMLAAKPQRWNEVKAMLKSRDWNVLGLALAIYDALGKSDVVEQAIKGFSVANQKEGVYSDLLKEVQTAAYRYSQHAA